MATFSSVYCSRAVRLEFGDVRVGLDLEHGEVRDAHDQYVDRAARIDDPPVGHQRTGLLDEALVTALRLDVGLRAGIVRVEAAQDPDACLVGGVGCAWYSATASPELAM